jgi:hypothetical protein
MVRNTTRTDPCILGVLLVAPRKSCLRELTAVDGGVAAIKRLSAPGAPALPEPHAIKRTGG